MDEQVAAPEVTSPETTAPPAEGTPQTQPEGTAPEGQAKEEKPPRTFTQDDLDRILAKERAKAERRAERYGYERAMREAAERQLQARQPTETQPAAAGGRPSPDQFRDWDSYQEALTDWKVEQKLMGIGEQARAVRAQAEAERKAAEVQAKLSSASERYEDFNEVVMAEDLPITQDMAEAILELGNVGHDVAYFLGTHKSEADRISRLGRVAQLREIDKIAATLTKPAQPTKVPPPITPNQGSGSVDKRLEEADYDEFVKIRRKQIAAKRGR